MNNNLKIYIIFFIVSSIAFADITPKFGIKNYFWPIEDEELYSNKNLVQNYGW